MGRPKGETWQEPLGSPERRERWRAFCARLPATIADIRRREGFDGRRQTWRTFDDALLMSEPPAAEPVRDVASRRPAVRNVPAAPAPAPITLPSAPLTCRSCGQEWLSEACCMVTAVEQAARRRDVLAGMGRAS
jgi:hypothetical protein